MSLTARESVEKESGRDQDASPSVSHEYVIPRNDGEPSFSSNRRQYHTTATTQTSYAPQYLIPGAFAVAGPEYDEGRDDWEDSTVQVGNDPPIIEQEEQSPASATLPTVDAVVVDPNHKRITQERSSLPPLVEAQVDDTVCSIQKRRTRIAVLLVVVVLLIGAIVGIALGVALRSFPENDTNGSTMAPSASPTSLAWIDAGSINVQGDGAILDLSPDGTRLALADDSPNVRVFNDNGDNSWSQLGNVIDFDAPNSVSLADTRLAIASVGGGVVSVYELQDNIWQQVGDTISAQGWTVVLSQDGNALAIEDTDTAQVYRLDESTTWTRMGNEIPTTFSRVNVAKAFTRLAMDNEGSTLLLDLSVYQYDEIGDRWNENMLAIESEPPDTPVSMSGDGQTVAVAQPQSNTNGLNSGRVQVFRFQDTGWNQLGNDIIGDGSVNGFWGWSHALSIDGRRIAIMNNPSVGRPRAVVFRVDGPRWVRLLEEVPSAVYNGTVVLSDGGNRVAIGGSDTVKLYDVVGD